MPPALAGLFSGDSDENVTKQWDQAPSRARGEVLRLLSTGITILKDPG